MFQSCDIVPMLQKDKPLPHSTKSLKCNDIEKNLFIDGRSTLPLNVNFLL